MSGQSQLGMGNNSVFFLSVLIFYAWEKYKAKQLRSWNFCKVGVFIALPFLLKLKLSKLENQICEEFLIWLIKIWFHCLKIQGTGAAPDWGQAKKSWPYQLDLWQYLLKTALGLTIFSRDFTFFRNYNFSTNITIRLVFFSLFSFGDSTSEQTRKLRNYGKSLSSDTPLLGLTWMAAENNW